MAIRKNSTALQGHYSKKQMEERVEKEKRFAGDSDNIVIPDFIENDVVARNEFLRIVNELKKVNLVTNVDSTMLGIYADCYSKYTEVTSKLANSPLLIDYTNKGGETNSIPNPYIKIQQQYMQTLIKLSERFGLDSLSRTKLASSQPSDKEEKEDALLSLMKEMRKDNLSA